MYDIKKAGILSRPFFIRLGSLRFARFLQEGAEIKRASMNEPYIPPSIQWTEVAAEAGIAQSEAVISADAGRYERENW